MQTTASAFDPPSPTYVSTLFVVAASLYLLQLVATFLAPEDDAERANMSGDD